jgi:hypothetical protein
VYESLREIEYLPSRLVVTPIVVPGTTTVTPGMGKPSSELVTVPVITFVCALAIPILVIKNKHVSQIVNFLIINRFG